MPDTYLKTLSTGENTYKVMTPDDLPETFPPSEHNHDDRYNTKLEMTGLLAGKADTDHNHDDRYYTETEMNALLNNKSDLDHIHDDRYYTESETNILLAGKANVVHAHGDITGEGKITANAVDISNGDRLTVVDASDGNKIKRTNISFDGSTATQALSKKGTFESFAPASHNHDDLYYTEGEIDNKLAEKVDEAPTDHKTYGRKDGEWRELDTSLVEWGEIGGTLANQTDLQNALDDKANVDDLGTMAAEDDAPSDDKQYVRKNGDWSEIEELEWGNIVGDMSDQEDLQNALDSKADADIVTVTAASMVAPQNLVKGDLIYVNGTLYKATENIANGSALTVNSNVVVTTVDEELKTLDFRKADIDGSYPDLTVGNAEQLVSTVGIEENTPYTFRTTGGSVDVGDRLMLKEVTGGTIAWNQLMTDIDDVSQLTNYGVNNGTLSYSEGAITITPNVDQSNKNFGQKTVSSKAAIIGHKYFYSTYLKISKLIGTVTIAPKIGQTIQLPNFPENVDSYISGIINPTASGDLRFFIYPWGTTASNTDGTETATIHDPMIIDLTQMFGSTIADYIYSLEQAEAGAGVAWFRKLFPKDYYPYNAGELLSVNASAHKTVGFNLINADNLFPTIGLTKQSDGSWYASNSSVVANKLIWDNKSGYNGQICISYDYKYNSAENQGGRFRFHYTDGTVTDCYANASQTYVHKTVISATGKVVDHIESTYGTGSVSVWWKDVNINLSWDGERDGEYEKYEEHSYPLDSSLTLRGIPKLDASNNLCYDGDSYEPDGRVTRRYGIVDLGTLTDWAISVLNEHNRFHSATLHQLVKESSPNLICTKYEISQSHSTTYPGDDLIATTGVGSSARVWIWDDSYTTAADFKAAMSGVYLVYELAEPTTESADPYQETQICNDFGTEEFIVTEQSGVAIPVGNTAIYQPNLRAKLEMAPDSPDGDGDYIVRQTNGENEYVSLYDAVYSKGQTYTKSEVDTVISNLKGMITVVTGEMKAPKNLVKGDLVIVNNTLYKVSSNIASGTTLTVGSNVIATTVEAEINSKDSTEVTNSLDARLTSLENQSNFFARYGVTGVGGSAAALTRIFEAAGMTGQVGTDGDNSAVVNDFDSTIFNRPKCVGTWSLVDGKAKFNINAYEGDSNYTEDGSMGDYVAVECPRLYFYRNDYYSIVSQYQYPGYRPFSIFCKDNNPLNNNPANLLEKVYLPAYALALKDGHAVSLPGYDNEQGSYKQLVDAARTYGDGSLGNLAMIQPASVAFYEETLMEIEFATQNLQLIMAGCSSLRHSNDDRVTFFDNSYTKLLTSNYFASRVAGEYISIIPTNVDINSSAILATHRITSITRCDENGVESSSGTHQLLVVEDLGKNYYTYDTTGATEYRIAVRPYRTGACSAVSTPSGSPVHKTNGYYPMKYRGRENVYGNQYWTAMDLFNQRLGTDDNDYYLKWFYLNNPAQYIPASASKPDATDLASELFTELDLVTEHANYVNGYIKSKKFSEKYPDIWIPYETVGGSASTYYADYAYLVNSYTVRSARFGGTWSSGPSDGPSYLIAYYAPAGAYASYGAHLYIKQG